MAGSFLKGGYCEAWSSELVLLGTVEHSRF